MSASNSISQLLEQFLELNTNSLETFNRINEAITTDKETVVIDLYNSKTKQNESIQIPAFGYLKREIERLNNNLNAISGVSGSDANIRLKDGSYRNILTSKLKSPSNSINSIASPTEFGTKLNEFFEDFLNPLLTINVDVTGQIPVETEKVYVERFIFNGNNANSSVLFDERYKGSSEISYSSFTDDLIKDGLDYYLDSGVIDMPIRSIQYNGKFDVIKIDIAQKSVIVNGTTETRSIKLFTLNKLSYTDASKNVKDTETLKVSDSLIVNSGNYSTRYLIKSIDSSTSQVELELIEGFESIKLGANQLGIYKAVDTNLGIEIKIGFDERQVVFVKPIDPNSKIPAEEYSPGIGFYSNELSITLANGDTSTLAKYYKNEVADFGQFIKALKVDYIPPASVGITPAVPVLDVNNFKVVQINKHLTDNTTSDKIKQLKSDKISTEQNIKKIDEAIKQKKAVLNTKKFESSAEKDNRKNELFSLISERDNESKLYASIVSDIKASADSTDIASVSPKFKVRGFWAIPEPRTIGDEVSQQVVKFKTRYRYVSTTGKTSNVEQLEFNDSVNGTKKTAAFSNWNEIDGIVRKRAINSSGKYEWILENEEDAQAINFNSLDISINPGEIVEIMIKSVSEAGFPSNPVESDWSEIIKVEFPEGALTTTSTSDIAKTNELDYIKVGIKQDLEAAGVYSHVSDSFESGGKVYNHAAETIASGFTTATQGTISVYEKLLSLQNEVLRLRDIIEGNVGELLVNLIDENGNVTNVSNNTTVKLFAGYYTTEIPSDNYKGYIVTKNFKIELSNTKATDLELISRIIGDTTKPAYVSSQDQVFGLGTGTIDPTISANEYYTNEAQYDLVPVIYQNISNDDLNTYNYLNEGPEQSSQLRGQFIYSRFKNIANDDTLYESSDIDATETSGFDINEYGISYPITGVSVIDGVKDFWVNNNPAVAGSFPISLNVVDDFVWNGGYDNNIPQITAIGASNGITLDAYSNGMFMHVNHPLINTASPMEAIEIMSNGLVGMTKTATRKANDAYGNKQTPLKLVKTINNAGNSALRSTIKNSFEPNDQYLLGGHSCGSFLYISPLTKESLSVDASNKSGKKIVPGGKANSISLDLIFQYRMTDYYGPGSVGIGKVGGVISNIFNNLTYSKKIGLDILDKNGIDFKFDIEVYAKYKPLGKNINNITSSMLSNYNNNASVTGIGKRRYLSDTIDFAAPEIYNY